MKGELEGLFGPVDMESPPSPFSFTDYYLSELGPDLKRKFLSFGHFIHPKRLAEIKSLANELERRFQCQEGKRGINIDPGYLEAGKLVLATTKNQQHRICLGKGIYAEVTLRFRRGRFEPWEWTYPDYRSRAYIDFFTKARKLYLEQLPRDG